MKKKLHILFINSWYPSRVMPTNGDFIQRHAEAVAMNTKVTSIHIISDKNCDATIEFTDEMIHNVRTLIGYVSYTNNPILKGIRFINAFRTIIKKVDDFNMVHVNRIFPLGIFALYLKYVKKIPFIVSEHWTGFLKVRHSMISFYEMRMTKSIVKNASFTCTVSKNLAAAMMQLGLKGNYQVIPNVVNTDLFRPGNVKKDRFTLLHISNMIDEHKNVSGLLSVVAKLKDKITDMKLILIGSDSDSYLDLIRKLRMQDQVEIVPQIEHHKVIDYMHQSNVFVLFSNYENLPCVILESLSCGLPVISTDVGGISEFFPDDFGYLIPKNDSTKLRETLLKFYQTKKVYDSTKMHQYVIDNFSPEVINKAFLTCYLKALDE